MAFWRDHGCLACRLQGFDHPFIRVECLVREQYLCLHVRQERIRSDQIMNLTGGQDDLQWITQRVRQHVKFAAQPASAVPDRLIFAGFFSRRRCADARA